MTAFSLATVLFVKANNQTSKSSLFLANLEILAQTGEGIEETCNQEVYEDYVWDYNCSGIYNSYDDRAGTTRIDTFCFSGSFDSVDTPCWSGCQFVVRDCYGTIINQEIYEYGTKC